MANTTIDQLDARITGYLTRMRELTLENSNLKSLKEKLEKELSDCKADIKNMQREIDLYQKEIEELNQQLKQRE